MLSLLGELRPTLRGWLLAATSCSDLEILKPWQPELVLLPPGVSASLKVKAAFHLVRFSTVLLVPAFSSRGYEAQTWVQKTPGTDHAWLARGLNSDQPNSSCVTSGKARDFPESPV